MSSLAIEFAKALSTVNRPGAFFVAGTEQILAPGLTVEGVGPIALPLLPAQAERLIATAERAPYGRGEDTVTDISVRRTWQIDASRVRIKGKHWLQTIRAIVTRVAEGLGVAEPVETEFYKLLVYDRGSFFVSHRDTEKAPGMFATLVLVLPSVSEGGTLIVRHEKREAHLDLWCEEPSEIAFAAFYADCIHEVRPVTEGYRLALIYNLTRRGSRQLPKPPNYDREQQTIQTLLKKWVIAPRLPADGEPEKLIYTLEHAYTPAELGFGSLKGADAGIAEVVIAATQQSGCDVHLALISIEESGSAEYTGDDYPSRRGRYRDEEDGDEFRVVEVTDRRAVASAWRRSNGEPSPLTDIPILASEFSPPVSFEELEPDEEHFHEATGNEGASFERTYRRAALILWPSDRLLAVINQAGRGATLPLLTDLADRWAAAGAERDLSLWYQACVLAEHIIRTWRMDRWYPHRDKKPTDAGRFLNLLLRLGDLTGLQAFVTALTGRHGLDQGDCAALATALGSLPPERAAPLTQSLIENAAELALGPCANLLARLSEPHPVLVIGSARALVAALPGAPVRGSASQTWRRDPSVGSEFIADLFTALGRIDTTLAAAATDHVLQCPATYDFDTVVVPAMRTLLGRSETATLAAVQRLRTACVTHLDTRIAQPLEAPIDWRRDDTLGCRCRDCQALGAYLRDASQQVWVFAAAESRRRHLEVTIRNARCDLDTMTERTGNPHRLICTKNQADYKRRSVQRKKDLAQRRRMVG